MDLYVPSCWNYLLSMTFPDNGVGIKHNHGKVRENIFDPCPYFYDHRVLYTHNEGVQVNLVFQSNDKHYWVRAEKLHILSGTKGRFVEITDQMYFLKEGEDGIISLTEGVIPVKAEINWIEPHWVKGKDY